MEFKKKISVWSQAFALNMGGLNRTPRERLSFATIIVDAVVVELGSSPAPHVRTVIAQFAADWRRSLMTDGYLKRGTRYHGSVEIDLLHPRLLGGENKRRLLTEFGIDIGRLKLHERILLVHYHVVVDAKGHQDGYRKAVASAFPGHRRVVINPIHQTGTVAENISNLAGYMTKMRLRYSQAYEGKKTKFFADYEPEWRDWFRKFVSDLLPNLTISSIKSRAASSEQFATPERPNSHLYTAMDVNESRAFTAILPRASARAVEIGQDYDHQHEHDDHQHEHDDHQHEHGDHQNEHDYYQHKHDYYQNEQYASLKISMAVRSNLSAAPSGLSAGLGTCVQPNRRAGNPSGAEALTFIRERLAEKRQSTCIRSPPSDQNSQDIAARGPPTLVDGKCQDIRRLAEPSPFAPPITLVPDAQFGWVSATANHPVRQPLDRTSS